MIYKEYGNTGKKVSAIGFGGMRFDAEDMASGNFEKCAELLHYAHEKGINYFDTAPFYCNEKSEEVFGIAFKNMKRDSFYVTSKTHFGTLYNEPTRDNFFKRLETSLTKMNVDSIDFYHLWCMLTPERYETQCNALYEYFQEAKSQGLIKEIVVSSHMGSDGISPIINSNKFSGILLGYNPLNYRFRQEAIREAYNNGMGVVAMNPLGGGTIPQNPSFFDYLTENTDLTVAQASVRYVASHKEIAVALNGFTTKEHIDDAVKAVENIKLQSIDEMNLKFQNIGDKAKTLCTGCEICSDCPVDIAVPKFMDTYNQKLFTGNDSSMSWRMEKHWNISQDDTDKCVECGKCENVCPHNLPIIERLKLISQI